MLVACALSVGLYAVAGMYPKPAPGWLSTIWMVVITVPLTARRRWPIPVALVIAVAFMGGQLLHVPEALIGNIALFLAIYSVGAWSANRRAAMVSRLLITAGMLIWLVVSLFITATDPTALPGFSRVGALSPLVAFSLLQIITNILYFGGAYLFGERAWISARERSDLEQRTAELERERERTAAQAVALDRVRIARELHDVVAHHVSVMGIQAGAARVTLDADPAAARAALGVVEDTSRTAIDELRKMLTTLRDSDSDTGSVDAVGAAGGGAGGPAGTAPSTLGVGGIPALVEESTTTGLPTSFEIVGAPRTLPAVVSLNLFRIAQESLTNVRKHAGPEASADVRLRYLPESVELEIGNTGSVAARRSTGGLGQIGMRERVAASGGFLEAGPRSRGGYLVRAVVPVAGGASGAGGTGAGGASPEAGAQTAVTITPAESVAAAAPTESITSAPEPTESRP
ncbi:sensor histidine kinase [Schumannella soli]|uniref:histidine kinase n=2 Tax=Schumannella soli TaxID=2590779 RepID=A0A506Y9L4_9MICO|nr:sensor histidine kinase [Schumannella soli]